MEIALNIKRIVSVENIDELCDLISENQLCTDLTCDECPIEKLQENNRR